MPSRLSRGLMQSATLAVLIVGCAGEKHPETLPVQGKVTYAGKPVPAGTITFQSDSGQAAVGEIQPDGSYRLGSFAKDDGAVLGHHRVMIVANTADPTKIPGSSPGYVPPKDLVPRKYSQLETSGLEAEVSKDKTTWDFDLK
jgi:hypothetical protein